MAEQDPKQDRGKISISDTTSATCDCTGTGYTETKKDSALTPQKTEELREVLLKQLTALNADKTSNKLDPLLRKSWFPNTDPSSNTQTLLANCTAEQLLSIKGDLEKIAAPDEMGVYLVYSENDSAPKVDKTPDKSRRIIPVCATCGNKAERRCRLCSWTHFCRKCVVEHPCMVKQRSKEPSGSAITSKPEVDYLTEQARNIPGSSIVDPEDYLFLL